MVERNLSRRDSVILALFALALVALPPLACDDQGREIYQALLESFAGEEPMAREPRETAEKAIARLLRGADFFSGIERKAREEDGVSWSAAVNYDARGGDGREARLEIEARLDLQRDGAFRGRMTHLSTRPSGRERRHSSEALWLDRLLYTRTDDADFFVRRSYSREHERWRDAPLASISGLLAALAPHLDFEREDDERYRVKKRASVKEFETDMAPAKLRETVAGWPHWLAGSYELAAVDGWVRFDHSSRAVLGVQLTARLRARDRAARAEATTIDIEARGALGALSADASRLAVPERRRPPERERSMHRVKRLLLPWIELDGVRDDGRP